MVSIERAGGMGPDDDEEVVSGRKVVLEEAKRLAKSATDEVSSRRRSDGSRDGKTDPAPRESIGCRDAPQWSITVGTAVFTEPLEVPLEDDSAVGLQWKTIAHDV